MYDQTQPFAHKNVTVDYVVDLLSSSGFERISQIFWFLYEDQRFATRKRILAGSV